MNRQSIHQQIETLLKIINEQHQSIRNNSGSAPQVEIDFLLQNLRQLYEAALMLNHTNALSSLDEIKMAVAQKILSEKRTVEMKTADVTKQENEKLSGDGRFTELPPSDEPLIPAVIPGTSASLGVNTANNPTVNASESIESPPVVTMDDVIAKTAALASSQPASQIKKKTAYDLNSSLYEEKATLSKKFTSNETLHKKVAPQRSSTLSDKLHLKPIKDLKSAIGINEKFLFVSRLFNGNLQQYSEAIERLDNESSLAPAKEFIRNELETKFDWNSNDEHVKSFMELIERRFS